MSFGLYVHIPYCLQKCHYCDFTTFSLEHRLDMDSYTELLLMELRQRRKDLPAQKKISSVYFGGGTPSLLPTQHILTLLKELDNLGFQKESEAEVTIEINPGTIDQKRLDFYLRAGINRFSVGVQTFNEKFLKSSGREHGAAESEQTLKLLKSAGVNFSLDLLFGLPHQTPEDVAKDLHRMLEFDPPHVSAYCLTVPEGHPMNQNRASDPDQEAMFDMIENTLAGAGILRYEISNYARSGFESRHNLLYWNDQPYWGVGVSAHSYFPSFGDGYGLRYWNSSKASEYEAEVKGDLATPVTRKEPLQLHEAMTDYCHTQLRKISGLSIPDFEKKFGPGPSSLMLSRAAVSERGGLTERVSETHFRLTSKGRKLANLSFLEFTFARDELMD